MKTVHVTDEATACPWSVFGRLCSKSSDLLMPLAKLLCQRAWERTARCDSYQEDGSACSIRSIWKITSRPKISCAASISAWFSVICAPT